MVQYRYWFNGLTAPYWPMGACPRVLALNLKWLILGTYLAMAPVFCKPQPKRCLMPLRQGGHALHCEVLEWCILVGCDTCKSACSVCTTPDAMVGQLQSGLAGVYDVKALCSYYACAQARHVDGLECYVHVQEQCVLPPRWQKALIWSCNCCNWGKQQPAATQACLCLAGSWEMNYIDIHRY